MKNFVQDCPFLKPTFRALHICPYSALILLELAQETVKELQKLGVGTSVPQDKVL